MKKVNLKWLLEIADTKPLLFSIALMLIAIVSLSAVIQNRENKLTSCENERKILQANFDSRIDSISREYRLREQNLNVEVKNTLELMINDYKDQITELKRLNQKTASTLTKNQAIIIKNNDKIKKLKE